MVCKLSSKKIVKGDRVVLSKPTDTTESPGFGPILDRHVGNVLLVREVAQADGYRLVLVWETGLPLRDSWLSVL